MAAHNRAGGPTPMLGEKYPAVDARSYVRGGTNTVNVVNVLRARIQELEDENAALKDENEDMFIFACKR